MTLAPTLRGVTGMPPSVRVPDLPDPFPSFLTTVDHTPEGCGVMLRAFPCGGSQPSAESSALQKNVPPFPPLFLLQGVGTHRYTAPLLIGPLTPGTPAYSLIPHGGFPPSIWCGGGGVGTTSPRVTKSPEGEGGGAGVRRGVVLNDATEMVVDADVDVAP